MKKKLIYAMVIFSLTIFLLTPTISGSRNSQVYEYISNTDGTLTIVEYLGNEHMVAVPDTLMGKAVSAVGEGVFAGKTEIEKVYISKGVRSIGASAFSGCASLTELTLPSSIIEVGENAFSGCVGLTKINMSKGIKVLGAAAFSACEALEYISLPESIHTIGEDAFLGCEALDFVVVSNRSPTAQYGAGCFGAAKIYAYAGSAAQTYATQQGLSFSPVSGVGDFEYTIISTGAKIIGCSSTAEAIVVPETLGGHKVVEIADRALSAEAGRSTAAKIVILPDTISTIGNFAFSGSLIEYIRLSDSLTYVGQYAFRNCVDLRTIDIPSGVRRIEVETFYGCTALRSVSLSPAQIGSGAFRNCSSLSLIYFGGSEPVCDYRDTVAALVSFAGVGNMSVKIIENTNWVLTENKWYPNGSGAYSGYEVEIQNHNCFFIEKVISDTSCANSGVSEFYCPFCGESYIETYPRKEHSFVSTGEVDGVETYRCLVCNESHAVYHIDHALILPKINSENPQGSMMSSVDIFFRGTLLISGKDYTYKEKYNDEYKRVELTFTGQGDYVGSYDMAYRIKDKRWLSSHIVTVNGADGGGRYYQNDFVQLEANTPPAGMEMGEWTISGDVEFMSKGTNGASFVMPAQDVTVTLIFKEIESTTPPDTTDNTTPPNTTENTTTHPLETSEPPETDQPETDPFSRTQQGREFIKKAILWGSVLLVSLGLMAAVSIILFKKEKDK